MKDSKPLVSILIINHNGKKYLKDCITSLWNQTYSNFELILIDNKSSDDSVELVQRSFPDVKIISNQDNLGFAYGCNIGIRASKGSLICLFNHDAIADKDWLSTLVIAIQRSENIAAVAGKVYYWGNIHGKDAIFCTWTKVDPYTACAYNFKGDEPMSNVDYLTGAAMLVKRNVIDKIGLLDPDYFLYFEETEWCARMIRASYDLVYVPEAVIWHVVSVTLLDAPNSKLYLMTRNRMRFALKNFDLDHLPIYFAFYAVESIYDLVSAMRGGNFLPRAKLRAKALVWNIINLSCTISARRADFRSLKNSGRPLRSYNRSLPLKEYRIGRLERWLKILVK